ncbi:MAG TPA: late competence development ComFB family protein [Methylibium sp.]|uniref:late competence development ComFB family protein n=1 Tax=Methylibium sp. TaxID=2067992 RepID=UPI002DBB6864|nr:late competence development ComFB family protein [Methylibium sp.]HEU4458031.1 late competence development ComFB family protein [Methylibium sp.]
MSADFTSIHNYYERAVFEAVVASAAGYPGVHEDKWPDVACVALNRLPTRYIRHEVDLAFYLTDKERAALDAAVTESVAYAFEFVQARTAMRAR